MRRISHIEQPQTITHILDHLGLSYDLQQVEDSQLHIALSPGLLIPLRDEYRGLAVILGGRFDFYLVGDQRIIPSAMVRVSFYFSV